MQFGGPRGPFLTARLAFSRETCVGDVAIDGFPFRSESGSQTILVCPSRKFSNASEYIVSCEVVMELGNIHAAFLGVVAVDTTGRRRVELGGSASQKGYRRNVQKEGPVVGIHKRIEEGHAAFGNERGERSACIDGIDAVAVSSGRRRWGLLVMVDENVFQLKSVKHVVNGARFGLVVEVGIEVA